MKFKTSISRAFKNSWCAGILAFLSLGVSCCLAVYALAASLQCVYENVSPANKGSAIFFSPISVSGSMLELLVRDYGTSERQPLFIAYVEDYDFQKHVEVNGPALDRLLVQRGGAGKKVFADANKWDQQCHHPWPWEMYGR